MNGSILNREGVVKYFFDETLPITSESALFCWSHLL